MKCIIIGHEFAEANTGNLYCKLEVRPAMMSGLHLSTM